MKMSKIIIVSGFFNPLHVGHLDMFEEAKKRADKLVVIVNNDVQQKIKKGRVIISETDRARIVEAIAVVDEVVLSIDETYGQPMTLKKIVTEHYPNEDVIFGNGGDRNGLGVLPEDEQEVIVKYSIKTCFDLGTTKPDSSTRINKALGRE